MVSVTISAPRQKLAKNAGIAIGPILFIVAVLGILAAAIAAGSGSFTASTSSESSRSKAAALIDIGQHLKIGFDRISGNGIDFDDIIIDPTATSDTDELFSPSGGGIGAPSVTMSATPATNIWYYPLIGIPRLGTMANGVRVAIIEVSGDVCDEINLKAVALSATPAVFDIDDLYVDTGTTPVDGTDWPAGLQGKPTGCIHVNAQGTMTAGYYFYQVLGIK